jgi:hypothetical protein
MKKIINLGKIDYNNTGKKANAVDIEIELKEDKNGLPVFTACGNIWNNIKTDIYSGGQNLDEIKELFPKSEIVKTIHELWTKYHLNDTHAGKPIQENAIKEWQAKGNKYDYTNACEYLKSINLFEVDGYKYGHGWIYFPIPESDLQKIKSLLQ